MSWEKPLQDMKRFLQPVHSHPWSIKRHPGQLILRPEPACPNPKFQAPPREEIERCRLLCQHCGMPVVIIKHQIPNPEGFRGIRCRHQRHHRRELIAKRLANKMIANQERRVSGALHKTSLCNPLLSRLHPLANHTKTKRVCVTHRIAPCKMDRYRQCLSIPVHLTRKLSRRLSGSCSPISSITPNRRARTAQSS